MIDGGQNLSAVKTKIYLWNDAICVVEVADDIYFHLDFSKFRWRFFSRSFVHDFPTKLITNAGL